MIYLLLTLSVVINVLAVLYIRFLLKNLVYQNELANDLIQSANGLKNHLTNLHEMEMFYGEPIIQNLITHCNEVTEVIEDFEYLILGEEEDIGEEVFDEENEKKKN